jgi:hypothetical protein
MLHISSENVSSIDECVTVLQPVYMLVMYLQWVRLLSAATAGLPGAYTLGPGSAMQVSVLGLFCRWWPLMSSAATAWEAFHGCITEESHVAVRGAMQCMQCRPWHVLPDESRETPLSLAA